MAQQSPNERVTMASRGLSLARESEPYCVWSTAGVLAPLVCGRRLDCERCPLYSALRSERGLPSIHPDSGSEQKYLRLDLSEEIARLSAGDDRLAQVLSPFRFFMLKRGLYYGSGHSWLEAKGVSLCRLGADDFLASVLPELDAVVLPEDASHVDPGNPLAWFVVRGEMVPLLSPVSASILHVNGELLATPSLVKRDPYGAGWVAEVDTRRLDAAVQHLRYSEIATETFLADARRMCEQIVRALEASGKELGRRSQDGGSLLSTPADALGLHRYLEIVRDVIGGPARSKAC